ncbi:hypothetical protein AB4160_10865, partial [Shewanella sp. 10N.286.51.B8]
MALAFCLCAFQTSFGLKSWRFAHTRPRWVKQLTPLGSPQQPLRHLLKSERFPTGIEYSTFFLIYGLNEIERLQLRALTAENGVNGV